MTILLIQGANMEYLGKREPAFYGTTTAEELEAILHREAAARDLELDIRTTNIEGEAITWIYQAERDGFEGLIMNPAGFHYAGYALRDCLKGVSLPYIEVHMTNLERRGLHSVMAEQADGMVTGLGVDSYVLGLEAMRRLLDRSP